MAQATTSPDYVQTSVDPTLTEAQSPSGGKKSLFGKIKEKTKGKTKKLKTKIKPGSKDGEAGAEDTSSSSSSEDEVEAPHENAIQGMTQPEYQSRLDEGMAPRSVAGVVETSPDVPSSDFPGNFGKTPDTESQPKVDESDLSSNFQGLSTDEKEGSDSRVPAYDPGLPAESTEGDDSNKSVSGTAGSLAAGVVGAEGVKGDSDSSATEEVGNVTGKVADASKSWTQWAAEKVGIAKDTAASKIPSTTSADPTSTDPSATEEGKPLTQKAYEAVVGTKDAIQEKAVKPAYENVVATKDAVADQTTTTGSESSTTDPSQKSYMQKATSGIYAAKDSLLSSTQPGEQDKALSQKVTESVGNLPATIKSTLGFGGAKTSESSSPSTGSETSQLSPGEEAPGAPPQSPGLVSRFTSLFTGTKKPAGSEESETGVGTGSETAVSESK